jgi:hypothetical protein
VDERTAYVTFKVHPDHQAGRVSDVLAVALDANAKRL